MSTTSSKWASRRWLWNKWTRCALFLFPFREREGNSPLPQHFTIIETIPEDEFIDLVGRSTYKRKAISDQKLAAGVQDSFSDARRNVVYVILDTAGTIARHRQFENFSQVFRKHELINSVLINEHYLHGPEDKLCVL